MAKAPPLASRAEAREHDPIAAMLDADGVLTVEAERAEAISDETLRDLYRLMVVCRRLDQEGLNLQRQGELGLWGPYAGHEAAQVGAAMAMAQTDWIFPYYRDFAMAVCRGIDPGDDHDHLPRADARRLESATSAASLPSSSPWGRRCRTRSASRWAASSTTSRSPC